MRPVKNQQNELWEIIPVEDRKNAYVVKSFSNHVLDNKVLDVSGGSDAL